MKDTGPAGDHKAARVLDLTMPETAAGERLDRALVPLVEELSRGRLQTLIRAGAVTVDGRPGAVRLAVRGGERVTVRLPAPPEEHAGDATITLDVRHVDDDVAVISKPAGLVVHPGAGVPDGTLMNGLLHAFPSARGLPRAGIVHRLDRDTTGLLVVALSERAHRRLVASLSAREVTREYLAVVRGVPTAGGTVDAPIARHPRHRTRMAVVNGGREAITDYRVEQRFGHHSALALSLHTGRTHQIRVHMAHIGHPLVGDAVYGGRTRLVAGLDGALRRHLADFPRQALHARRLAFAHPATGERMEFEDSAPRDIRALLAALTRDDPLGT